jgi:hypothetical protein
MINNNKYKALWVFIIFIGFTSCGKDFITIDPRGTELESNFYKTEEEFFQGLVATYDVLQWGGTNGWTMKIGLLNAASDDTYAGGSDASDQPSWVAFDNFSLDPFLGPQSGFWNKNYSGIYRANLILEKITEVEGLSDEFVARTVAEVKFLRAFFYFDQVRLFGNIPLIDHVLTGDELYTQVQAPSSDIYALIEKDLTEAAAAFELPETLPADELGRVTKGAVNALLGKVILYQNNESRMAEAAALFEEVINTGIYSLEANFGDIFRADNEFGVESVFEIQHSGASRGGWESFANGTEGLYDVQFFGMRDYVGPDFAVGWSFCPVSEKLNDLMKFDPRYEHTIIDGKKLKLQGATFTEGYQNTDYFIRKYAGLQDEVALDGEPALNWGTNVREIRFADVLLMAAEAHARAGNALDARTYLNMVRQRISIQPITSASGDVLLNAIYRERQMELATEGHRFFDLVRTGRAAMELGDQGFVAGRNEILPIPQSEIDITEGNLIQNSGY